MTSYHLYFHDDADGITSSAIMLNFLRGRGDEIIDFNPIEYRANLKAEWASYKFGKPFILLDFMFHPEADWWIDHHQTAFIDPDWENNFKNDNQHHYDPEFGSCAGLLLKFLRTHHSYHAPKFIEKVAEVGHKVDTVGYKNVDEALDFTSIEWKLRLLLKRNKEGDNSYILITQKAIETLATIGIDDFVNLPEYHEYLDQFKNYGENLVAVYAEHSIIKGKVSFIDRSNFTGEQNHFAAYKIHPTALYEVCILHRGNSFGIHAGKNPWKDKNTNFHLGNLMKKYGGGGHRDVGGCVAKTHKEATEIATKIIDEINEND